MASTRRSASVNKIGNSKSSKDIAREKKLARQMFDLLLDNGRNPAEAMAKASQMLRQDEHPPSNGDIAIFPNAGYIPVTREEKMQRTKVNPASLKNLNRGPGRPPMKLPMPTDSSLNSRIARGMVRWREQKGYDSPSSACKKLGVNLQGWYRIERAIFPVTTIQRIDEYCEAMKIDVLDLIKLGTPA